jgi:hypothetical protein
MWMGRLRLTKTSSLACCLAGQLAVIQRLRHTYRTTLQRLQGNYHKDRQQLELQHRQQMEEVVGSMALPNAAACQLPGIKLAGMPDVEPRAALMPQPI